MTTYFTQQAGATEALPLMLNQILTHGDEVGSRQGERTVEILYPRIVLTKPWQREVLSPGRRASIVAQIAETMWVLAGRNDVEWLGRYLPRATEFSDDGQTWRSGYGPRLRAFSNGATHGQTPSDFSTDQLARVVNLLKADHGTRRAVINLWDPAVDSTAGKDVACNNWLHFLSRDGYLNLHVATRSNDAIWGWSGINAFEWSTLLEIVAGLTGMLVGKVHYSISSLHIYEKHWNRARDIAKGEVSQSYWFNLEDSPRFNEKLIPRSPDTGGFASMSDLDALVEEWFRIEKGIRKGELGQLAIDTFPEPMMRSWLRVIAWRWTGHVGNLAPLAGTRLHAAVMSSHEYLSGRPEVKKAVAQGGILTARAQSVPTIDAAAAGMLPRMTHEEALENQISVHLTPEDTLAVDFEFPGMSIAYPTSADAFREFVKNLHAEKSKVYGDSWKKRGELLSILPNIARKVDRLGVAGAGDTAADTVVDLLVYLVKYRLWLTDKGAVDITGALYRPNGESEITGVNRVLDLLGNRNSGGTGSVTFLKEQFDTLGTLAERDPEQAKPTSRARLVDAMLDHAYRLARKLWLDEEAAKADSGSVKHLRSGYGQ